MEIKSGSCVYVVGRQVAKAEKYTLHKSEVGDRECLLQIATDCRFNTELDRAAYILRELQGQAEALEEEFSEKHKLDKKPVAPLNYGLQFPELMDDFWSPECDERKVCVLGFRNVDKLIEMVPLSFIKDEGLRVDIKTSAWIMGKLLKLLAFAHTNGFSINQLGCKNVLIHRDQHYVLVFDWMKAQIHSGAIPLELRHKDITQAAKSVVSVLGGNFESIPDDPDGCEGYDQYAGLLSKFVRGGEVDALRGHSSFYELVEKLWKKEFHPFTTFRCPLT